MVELKKKILELKSNQEKKVIKLPDSKRFERRSFSESEERYRSLILKLQTAIMVHDGQGRIMICNPLAQELLGLPADQLLGKTLIDQEWHFLREDGSVMPVADYPASLALSTRQPLRGRVTGISRPDRDDVAWMLVNAEPEYDDAGEIEMVIVSFADITGLMRAEDAVQDTALKYRIVAENTYDWEFWLSPEEKFIYVSPSCKRITGYEADEFRGDPDLMGRIIHPDDRARFALHRHDALQRMLPCMIEFRIVRPDGTIGWVDHVCQPVFDEKGGFLGLRGSNREITERKEEEKSLAESWVRLGLALQSARMGVWHWDIIDNKRYFDDQVCHLLGINPATFTGAAEEFFGVIHPDDRETIKAALARTIEQDVLYETEYRAVWPDGSIHYITASGKLARDNEGRPLRIYGIIWDSTDRKRVENGIRKLNEELAQKVKERTAELEDKNRELEHFNKLFVGRELRMVELKERIKELEKKPGE